MPRPRNSPDVEKLFVLAEKLVDFAIRVASDKDASPAELAILPDIVKILYRLD